MKAIFQTQLHKLAIHFLFYTYIHEYMTTPWNKKKIVKLQFIFWLMVCIFVFFFAVGFPTTFMKQLFPTFTDKTPSNHLNTI